VHHDVAELERQLLKAAAAPYEGAPLPRPGPTLAQAYAIQRKIAACGNLPVMVWKLGLTGREARDAFGADEPTIGRLVASAIYCDRSDVDFVGAEMFAEAELIFEMGDDLPMQDRPYTRDDLCGALKGVYAGIEIVRTRFETSELPLALLIADNSMAHGLLLGRKLAGGWDDRFADLPVSLTRNDEAPVNGSTARVMGNPLDALVWLANWLRENEGSSLRREQLIAAGTCTGVTEIQAGDTIRVTIDGIESARVTLRGQNV
jgi:2-keto-4-pentenoate hydratase